MNGGSPGRLLFRLCAAAFLADMALYLVMTGIPYKALALGAGPLLLGLLPAARALPYSLTTVWAGKKTEGRERLGIARATLAVTAVAAALLIVVPSVPWIYVALAVVGLGLAFFWPALQATLADLAGRGAVTGNLGWFNIAWSTGKATGFLIGGFILSAFGFPALFAGAGVALLAVSVLLATLRRHVRQRESVPAADPVPAVRIPTAEARRFRLAAWIANAVAFGIGAVLNHHYPKWLEEMGRGEALFGGYLGLIFASQTVTFAVLAGNAAWRYRLTPLILAQVPLVIVLALLPRLHAPALILATAPVVGAGLGMTYFASIVYSVEATATRGKHAGMHEALLGWGAMLLPAVGGWLARATGDLQAPYLFAAAAGTASILVQVLVVSGHPGGGPRIEPGTEEVRGGY